MNKHKSQIPRQVEAIEYPDVIPRPPDWTFGSRLKYVMMIRNVSCKELGRQIGLEASTISGYRTDYHTPSAECIASIAKVLNVSADYLVGLHTTPDPNTMPRPR